MKRIILLSLLAHVTFIGALGFLPGWTSTKRVEYEPVYTVNVLTPSELPRVKKVQTSSARKAPATRKLVRVQDNTKKIPLETPKRPRKPKKKESKKEDKGQKAPEKKPDGAHENLQSQNIRLDAESFPYPEYLENIVDRIKSNWIPTLSADRNSAPSVTIFFRIGRDGTISDVFVEVGSGSVPFDKATLSAVLASDPMLPLPPQFRQENLGVHFVFEY